jgi:ParB family chromosome partitioning protein
MSKKSSGLGRDFFAILDDNLINDKQSTSEMIRISDIEPRKDQPRKNFDREALDALAESIGIYGVLQPIIVRENASMPGLYEIIAGERRWRAAKMAGLNEIPAVILDGDDLKTAQVALIENIQREDLNPVEEAMAYGALIDRFDLTQEQVAKQVGKSRAAVANALRLLSLPQEVIDYLEDGSMSAGHARALLGLINEEAIIPTADKIVERDLSVRETEQLVKRMNTVVEAPDEEYTELNSEAGRLKLYIKEIERRSMSALGKRVKITHTPRKKAIEITYETNEDLENMLKTLCGEDIFDNI